LGGEKKTSIISPSDESRPGWIRSTRRASGPREKSRRDNSRLADRKKPSEAATRRETRGGWGGDARWGSGNRATRSQEGGLVGVGGRTRGGEHAGRRGEPRAVLGGVRHVVRVRRRAVTRIARYPRRLRGRVPRRTARAGARAERAGRGTRRVPARGPLDLRAGSTRGRRDPTARGGEREHRARWTCRRWMTASRFFAGAGGGDARRGSR
jgi:hypothetical protein